MTLDETIRTDIEGRIRSGEWRPGYRIPFEHELVSSYGCARATVNKALTALVAAGLIERRRKAGSFVAHPQVHSAMLAIPDIENIIVGRGEVYRFATANRHVRKARENVAEEQLLREDGDLLAIDGTHFADMLPFAFEERIICLSTVPEASTAVFDATAPGSWLLRHIPWTQARHRIRAIAASPVVAEALAIPVASPCLQVERWTWRSGDAVTFVRQSFPGDRYDLIGDFEAHAE